MVWFFRGTGLNLMIGTTRSGTPHINGIEGTQECQPPAGDLRVWELTRGVGAAWSIDSVESEEIVYPGLKEHYTSLGGRAAGAIYYFAAGHGDPAMIGASIILPPESLHRVWELAKLLIGRRDLGYVLTMQFHGLRVEGADSPAPTFAEFTSKLSLDPRPYFSDEVTFKVSGTKHDDSRYGG